MASSARPFGLYGSASPGQTSGGDPYYYNAPATVSLSGKIGGNEAASGNMPSSGGIMSSVQNVVESVRLRAVRARATRTLFLQGYQSARQVVFGGENQGSSNQTSSSSFSLFSLSYQQMVNFAICIGVGMFFMFLAFLFLPMVVFAPQKFTLLFTLGCICWIAGLAMLQGPGTLVQAMIQKERLPFSLGYVGSLIGTLWATLIAHSYVLTVFCALCQIAALVAFIVSYFPGGIRMLVMIKDMVVSRVKEALGLRSGDSILPI